MKSNKERIYSKTMGKNDLVQRHLRRKSENINKADPKVKLRNLKQDEFQSLKRSRSHRFYFSIGQNGESLNLFPNKNTPQDNTVIHIDPQDSLKKRKKEELLIQSEKKVLESNPPFLMKVVTLEDESPFERERVPILKPIHNPLQQARLKSGYGAFSKKQKIILAIEQSLAGSWND